MSDWWLSDFRYYWAFDGAALNPYGIWECTNTKLHARLNSSFQTPEAAFEKKMLMGKNPSPKLSWCCWPRCAKNWINTSSIYRFHFIVKFFCSFFFFLLWISILIELRLLHQKLKSSAFLTTPLKCTFKWLLLKITTKLCMFLQMLTYVHCL